METLRVATFLAPSISVDFFESLLSYLETHMKVITTLRYESRFEVPPDDREDIFSDSHGIVDLAFMTANAFVQLKQRNSFELLPLSTVHYHPKNKDSSVAPGVWIDVVVNKNMKTIRDFHSEMRGIRWVRNLSDSLTQTLTLQSLKSMGESSSFFSNVLKSRSHLESLRMILQRKAHASAVDANCLEMYLRENPNEKEELFRIQSWGPLPPYALVMRKSMSKELKRMLFDTLRGMHETTDGKQLLSAFGIIQFDSITREDLETGEDLKETTKNMSFNTAYY